MLWPPRENDKIYPKVSIIILNWNGWRDTIECLESLYQITYPNYDVIVIDNGSKDESIEKIKEYCEGKIKVKSKFFEYDPSNKPIKVIEYTREEAEAGGGKEEEIADLPSNRKLVLIKNEKNYGFAEGNNIGMRYALKALNPDYILLLNNDTVVDKRFLDELVKVAESDEKIGIVGPKIYYYNEPRKIQHAGGIINMWTGRRYMRGCGEIDNIKYNKLMPVDFITGATLLIKRDVIYNIGLLDPEYFSYTEDIDWCYRTTKSGYRILYVPNAKVWHKVSATTGGEMSDTSLYYISRNTIIFMKKNANFYQWPTYILFSLFYFVRRLVLVDSIKRKSMIKGIMWHLKNSRKLF